MSVPSNIAEGAARETRADFLRFLFIARGSLSEIETQLLIAENLGYVADNQQPRADLASLRRMLAGLINQLKRQRVTSHPRAPRAPDPRSPVTDHQSPLTAPPSPVTDHPSPVTDHPKLALIGASGMLAQAVRRAAPAGTEVVGLDLPAFDLTNRSAVLDTLGGLRPQNIVNCAAYTDVEGCEDHEELAHRVNGVGVGHLAEAARNLGATLVHLSTDYVFDGAGSEPYREEAPTGPRSAYGRSKLAGERALLASGLARYYLIRTSWLYGPGGKNFVETMLRLAAERPELRVVADQVGSPTYTFDLAAAIFTLLARPVTRHPSPAYGTYHFANSGATSWHGFAEAILAEARGAGLPVLPERVLPIASADYPQRAARPAYSVLATAKYRAATGAPPPPWREGLARYFQARSAHPDPRS